MPPENELLDAASYMGATSMVAFVPALGGALVALHWSFDVGKPRPSEAGLMVNMRTGELNYVAMPDIINAQTQCPSGVFSRSYRSELAKFGKHSPGLPDGWIHNYDLIIKLATGTAKWEPFTLTYPNKAQEMIQPDLDGQGQPTGLAHSLSNALYQISVVPGDAVNTYKSVSIHWPRMRVTWTFEPHVTGVLVLRTIGEHDVKPGTTRFSYQPDRSLASVTWVEHGQTLLEFSYASGLLVAARSGAGYAVNYAYAQLNGNTVLWKVSQPLLSDAPPQDGFVYSYANELPYAALAQVAVPVGNGWSKSNVEYKDGHVSAIQFPSGERHDLVPVSGGGR